MNGKRLFRTLKLFLISDSYKRTQYLKKKNVFKSIGEGTVIMDRVIPLYANLIKIGNNVHLASRVTFVTHDVTHNMLNETFKGAGYQESIGCIEIGDNVFVGANVTILMDVKIGSNVVIGANSVVTKDIPDDSVAVGSPAKVIDSFDNFCQKRKRNIYPNDLKPVGQRVDKELENYMWAEFDKNHKKGS